MWSKLSFSKRLISTFLTVAILPMLIMVGVLYFTGTDGNVVIGAAVGTVILSAIMSLLFASLLNKEIEQKCCALDLFIGRMNDGDFSEEPPVESNDSFGAIGHKLSNVSQTFNAAISEFNSLISTIKRGRLRHRSDANIFNGSFAKLLESGNSLSDVLVGYIDAFPVPAMIVDKEFNVQYLNQTGCDVGWVEQRAGFRRQML